MRIYFLVLLFLSLMMAGCSIYPQVEDYSRATGPDIAHKIKCETRAAILELIPDQNDYRLRTVIAYSFYFQITETDDATISGNYVVPIHLGTFTLGYKAGKELQRESIQQFYLSYTFQNLVNMDDCYGPNARNYIYPITGNIGIIKLLRVYLRLMRDNQNGGLVQDITDKIEFRSKFFAGVSPKISLTTVTGKKLNIGSASSGEGFQPSRSDLHRVTIGLTPVLTPEAKRAKERSDKKEYNEQLKIKIDQDKQFKSTPQLIKIIDNNEKVIDFRKIIALDGGKAKKAHGASGEKEISDKKQKTYKPNPDVIRPVLRAPASRVLTDDELRRRAIRDLKRNERGDFDREIYDDFLRNR